MGIRLNTHDLAGCAAAGGAKVSAWSQCGGINCPDARAVAAAGGTCSDAPYRGFCCENGWTCNRNNPW